MKWVILLLLARNKTVGKGPCTVSISLMITDYQEVLPNRYATININTAHPL